MIAALCVTSTHHTTPLQPNGMEITLALVTALEAVTPGGVNPESS